MKPVYLLLTVSALLLSLPFDTRLHAQDRDTLVVEAFNFDDEPTLHSWGNIYQYDGMVAFPEPGGRYEKIIMLYTLKCDPSTKADNLPCGEWDYSTWTRVWEDSNTHWEIGRFITPYGGGLDLGPNGFTWEFDVTDYAPVLTDVRRITAGNSQELLDLRFLFISGIPTRDPISVTRLWTPGDKNYAKVVQDSVLEEIRVHLDPAAASYRINTRPQGGNFNGGPNTDNCAEFCDREHYLTIDGVERFRWNVWNECGDNPVYPQGGTWIHDRAGWCPGDIVTTQHHELTPWVNPGDTVAIDYGIESPEQFEPYGHWVFWADLVAYGPPNFTTDVGIERILAPSENGLYSRFNPWCGGPVLEVVNRGTETVTDITFVWSLDDKEEYRYTWTGSIPYLQSASIELPAPPEGHWLGSDGEMRVLIESVNGASDEYEPNNVATSVVTMPDRLPSEITINLLTNRLAALSTENYELTLYDGAGAVVFRKDDFGVEERIRIPLELEDGCYRLELVNPEGYGLDFWALRSQLGTGSISLESVDGDVLKTFGADFGNSIIYSFRVPAPQVEFNQSEIDFGRGRVGEPITRVLRLTPANSLGFSLYRTVFLAGGSYFRVVDVDPAIGDSLYVGRGDTVDVSIEFTPKAEREYSGKMLVTSSDSRGVLEIVTRGIGDNSVTSVADSRFDDTRSADLELSLTGDILSWSVREGNLPAGDLSIVDASGREVLRVGKTAARSRQLDVSDLPSGAYLLRLGNGEASLKHKFTIVR